MKIGLSKTRWPYRPTYLLAVLPLLLIFGLLWLRNSQHINSLPSALPHVQSQPADLTSKKQAEAEDIVESGFVFYDLSLPAWAKGFSMPIEGVQIPQRPERLPGAAREYRNGRHEGVDIFCAYGTPVLAAKDGYVLTVSANYHELSQAFRDRLLNISHRLVSTPAEVTDILHGRRVIIDHGYANCRWVITVYSHLAKVEPNLEPGAFVKQGTIIGYVGNSGTSEAGTDQGTHLHFEIRVNDHYLGEGMSREEAGRLYTLIMKGGQE